MMHTYSEGIMRWSYKTEHFSLKKEGLLGSAFLDEAEIEVSLNEFGKAGWELVSFMEVTDGMIAVFKQPLNQGISALSQEKRVETVNREEHPPVCEGKAAVVPVSDPLPEEQEDKDVGDIKIF